MATTDTPLDRETVDRILAEWPEEPTEIAERLLDKYGRPDEGAPSELLWYEPGPWNRAELYRDGVPHHFPKKHTDYLKQVIDYQVPPEKFDELGRFDGSVYVDRTNGELAAKCDKEAANFLAINLAHEIILDRMSVDEARQEYATTLVKKMMGGSPEMTEKFQFELPTGDQRDPDESIITDAMKEEIKEEMGMSAEAEEEE